MDLKYQANAIKLILSMMDGRTPTTGIIPYQPQKRAFAPAASVRLPRSSPERQGVESRRLDRMNVTDKTVFVIGNEGHGIDPAIVSAAHEKVYIPMEEGVESLNASAAAAVFMWQMRLSSGK